jgi:hypothetical protein
MRRRLRAVLGVSLWAPFVCFATLVGACDKRQDVEKKGKMLAATEIAEEEPELIPRPVRAVASVVDAGPLRFQAPLLHWMRDRAAAELRRGDAAALAASFDQLAGFAPSMEGYENWASIARDGADAARAASLDGARASCRECHQQYREAYRTRMRARPLASLFDIPPRRSL